MTSRFGITAMVVAGAAAYFLLSQPNLDGRSVTAPLSNVSSSPRSEPTAVSSAPPPASASSVSSAAISHDQLRGEPHILSALGVAAPPVVSPVWADEMEARILGHVALYPGTALTSLQAQCQEDACLLLMQAAQAFDPFLFEFDVFAEANGFQSATINSVDGSARRRIVTFRR